MSTKLVKGLYRKWVMSPNIPSLSLGSYDIINPMIRSPLIHPLPSRDIDELSVDPWIRRDPWLLQVELHGGAHGLFGPPEMVVKSKFFFFFFFRKFQGNLKGGEIL